MQCSSSVLAVYLQSRKLNYGKEENWVTTCKLVHCMYTAALQCICSVLAVYLQYTLQAHCRNTAGTLQVDRTLVFSNQLFGSFTIFPYLQGRTIYIQHHTKNMILWYRTSMATRSIFFENPSDNMKCPRRGKKLTLTKGRRFFLPNFYLKCKMLQKYQHFLRNLLLLL